MRLAKWEKEDTTLVYNCVNKQTLLRSEKLLDRSLGDVVFWLQSVESQPIRSGNWQGFLGAARHCLYQQLLAFALGVLRRSFPLE